MIKFTVTDRSPFEYLQTSRVCMNGKHKPWYLPIVNKCLNLNNLGTGANGKYILRDTSHVIHEACLVLWLNLNLCFRLFLKCYVPCMKYQNDGVIMTCQKWINSLFVYFPQSMGHKWNKNKLECLTIVFFEHTAFCKFEKRLSRTFAFYLCELRLPRNIFHITIVETTLVCTVLVLVLYRTYQDAF